MSLMLDDISFSTPQARRTSYSATWGTCSYHIHYMPPSLSNILLAGPHDVWDPGPDMRDLAQHPSYLAMVEADQGLVGRRPSHACQKPS